MFHWKVKDIKEGKKKNVKELVRSDEVNELVIDEEKPKFLKLIKHNEYSVVNQLKKTFSHWS
jgi:hypothetical protein